MLLGGGGLLGGWGCVSEGVSAQRGMSSQRGLCQGGVLPRGASGVCFWGVPLRGCLPRYGVYTGGGVLLWSCVLPGDVLPWVCAYRVDMLPGGCASEKMKKKGLMFLGPQPPPPPPYRCRHYYRLQGKVMFSQASVCHSVHNQPHHYSDTAHPCYGAVGTHPTGGNMIKFNDLKITR